MLKGEIILKGDKSITHRAIMLAAITEGKTKIINPSNCIDVQSSINVLNMCGSNMFYDNNAIINTSKIYKNPDNVLYCGNSGTTARLLIGLLFGQGISATIDGDKSLRKRPMDRVLKPLELMNLQYTSNNKKLPVTIYNSDIKSIKYTMEVPSAQVKSSILLASIACESPSDIVDNFNSRDHTERILDYFNKKNKKLSEFTYNIPGDISNASFLIAAAVCIENSDIIIRNVLYNKTRFGFIDTLINMNADITISNIKDVCNEQACDIRVKYNPDIISVDIPSENIVSMIDEIPAYAVVSCFSKGNTSLVNASELRIKESDRIASLCSHLLSANVNIQESTDGFSIKPKNKLYNTIKIESDDHRIIMASEIFNLIVSGDFSGEFTDKISISFPDFYSIIKSVIK